MRCFECDGEYRRVDHDYHMYGAFLVKVKALRCDKCGDLVFNETANSMIEESAKKKGLWGLESRTKVGQVGNSLDVKISKRLADYLGLRKGMEVKVYPDSKKRIVVKI